MTVPAEEIDRVHSRFELSNHFDVLGVKRDAGPELVKDAYDRLTLKWHIDRFAGQDLGKRAKKVDAIFKRVGEAYSVLSDPKERAEYTTRLDRERAGLSTDVNAILEGEDLLTDGLEELGRKRWAEAEASLAKAMGLNPDDPLIWVHHAWAVYRKGKGSDAAVRDAQSELQRAINTQENLPEAYRYLGTMAFERGDLDRALAWLRRCLEWEPRDVEATRLTRLIRSRQEKQKNPGGVIGFFKKLFE
ncbi:MAG: DnaJ domain-containing protein [Myxococcota bacterium]